MMSDYRQKDISKPKIMAKCVEGGRDSPSYSGGELLAKDRD